MSGNSRPVTSNQDGIHPDLLRHLDRHLAASFRKPVSLHTRHAFDRMQAAWRQAGRPPLVLDAGCGVGWSTLALAGRHPGHMVIGVDQSEERLQRGPAARPDNPANLLILRADVVDFWRLMAAAGMTLSHHYLLYPNPWPRKQHLGRRWHGHPVFPVIIALGGRIECRSNWLVYMQEFATALQHLTGQAAEVQGWCPDPDAVLTPFEGKYQASGHSLWRCHADIPAVVSSAPMLP